MRLGSLLLIILFLNYHESVGQSQRIVDSHNFILHYPAPLNSMSALRILEQFETDYKYFRDYFNLSVDGRISVRIYSSASSFSDATGLSHWEFGHVNDAGVHLQPTDEFRDNIFLSTIITQQAVRAILYSRRMNGCPLWLYEGAASYYANVRGVLPYPRHLQPRSLTDINEHLLHPQNEAEYSDAILYVALTFETLINRYGEAHATTLLRLFNGNYDFETAVRYSLGVSPEIAERNWRKDIGQVLTKMRQDRDHP
jgi:hypothetical protein